MVVTEYVIHSQQLQKTFILPTASSSKRKNKKYDNFSSVLCDETAHFEVSCNNHTVLLAS